MFMVKTNNFVRCHALVKPIVAAYSGQGMPGSGSGHGGGSGGSIREAGGAFGKMEAAREDEYFHRLQKAQLKNLTHQVDVELKNHIEQLKHHKDAIDRHKKRLQELEREQQEVDKERK